MKVFKFGGACIQHAAAIRKLKQLIKAESTSHVVLVISAFGKTTQGLEDVFQKRHDPQSYNATIQQLYQFHHKIIDCLLCSLQEKGIQALTLWREELVTTLTSVTEPTSLDRLYSKIVAGGELLASKLVYYYLQEQKMACTLLDARVCIKTTRSFCNAQVDWVATQCQIKQHVTRLFNQSQVVLTQGFIGSNTMGETTTLGKEGSDFTGAILASALGAQSLTIWKDVPGIMNADPKLFEGAIKFDRISYEDVAKMAFYGAKVLHPHTIQPLATYNIPLYIRPFHHHHEKGTEVSNGPDRITHPVYILQKGQALLLLRTSNLSFFDEVCLSEVLHLLTQHNTHTNVLTRSAYTAYVCLNVDLCETGRLVGALKEKFEVDYYQPVSLLTIMCQDEDLPSLLPQKEIIFSIQQKPGVYQAVLQDTEETLQ